jgi:hypothetical protein
MTENIANSLCGDEIVFDIPMQFVYDKKPQETMHVDLRSFPYVIGTPQILGMSFNTPKKITIEGKEYDFKVIPPKNDFCSCNADNAYRLVATKPIDIYKKRAELVRELSKPYKNFTRQINAARRRENHDQFFKLAKKHDALKIQAMKQLDEYDKTHNIDYDKIQSCDQLYGFMYSR